MATRHDHAKEAVASALDAVPPPHAAMAATASGRLRPAFDADGLDRPISDGR